MSERKFIVPEYGPFAGMRVIAAGSLIAMPMAATMLADFGAEVIHIERPGVGDTMRMLGPFAEVNGKKVATGWAQNGRNKLSLTLELNLKHPEVKELFYGLIREADIFMENMVWLEKLGIYDEELLKVNPKLVIVHISGLGNAKFGGVPSVCNRASYDMIGQAFSGWLYLQGYADRDPVVAKPYLNDYVSAFAALFGTLAAYTSAQKTGRGQVVDIAQFEAMAQYMYGTYTSYTMTGQVTERSGNLARDAALRPFPHQGRRPGGPGRLRPRRVQALYAGPRPRPGVFQLPGLLLRPGGPRQPQGPRAECQGGRVVRQPRRRGDREHHGGRARALLQGEHRKGHAGERAFPLPRRLGDL